MANTSAPVGFVPYAPGGGAGATSFNLRPVNIAYNNATKIYKGDPVQMLSTGYIGQWTEGTAASQLAGIFWGCEYVSVANGYLVQRPYWPGNDVATNGIVKAYIIPIDLSSPMWFVAQSDGTAIGQADIGSNVDVNIGTGSTSTGLSGAMLKQSTLATTNTLPFKIMGLFNGIGNGSDATSSYNLVYVAGNMTSSTGI